MCELNKDEPLTGVDYVNAPLSELIKHPNFSQHAANVIARISMMETKQIERIDLIGV